MARAYAAAAAAQGADQASEYSPYSSRSTPQTSPIVAFSFSAARMGSSRLPSPFGGLAQLLEPLVHGVLVAVGLERLQPLDLLALGLGVHAQDLDVVHLVGHVLVHAHHDVLLLPVALLVAPGRLLHLGADELDAWTEPPSSSTLSISSWARSSISSVSASTK